jgi:N-acetylmuramic acid 6-phosphate etherase
MAASAGTETVSPRYGALENWSDADLVAGIVEGQFAAIAAVQAASGQIAEAIARGAERLAGGGRLIYLGAGTSGRLAALDAAELLPTFGWPAERAIALMAGGRAALEQSLESNEDSEEEATAALDALSVSPRDLVIGVAASGRTPFAIAGLAHARKAGAMTVGLFNNRGAPLGDVSDLPILLDTGPEVIAGSTRMKAGTAQKAALNCISTGLMVRLGYVYRGLMVEMRPANAKLYDRAAKMVAQLSGASYDKARSALDAAEGSIKIATVMLSRSLDRQASATLLDAAGGDLRNVLD